MNKDYSFEISNIEDSLRKESNAVKFLFERAEEIDISLRDSSAGLSYPLNVERSTKEKIGRLLLKDITKRQKRHKKLKAKERIIKRILEVIL